MLCEFAPSHPSGLFRYGEDNGVAGMPRSIGAALSGFLARRDSGLDDDVVRICDPDAMHCFGSVVFVDEALDGLAELTHGAEQPVLEPPARQFGEELFDGIEPRARGRDEVCRAGASRAMLGPRCACGWSSCRGLAWCWTTSSRRLARTTLCRMQGMIDDFAACSSVINLLRSGCTSSPSTAVGCPQTGPNAAMPSPSSSRALSRPLASSVSFTTRPPDRLMSEPFRVGDPTVRRLLWDRCQ